MIEPINKLKVFIYEYLDFEEQRRLNNLDYSRNLFFSFPNDTVYLIDYLKSIIAYDEFRKVQLAIYEILRFVN